MIRRRLLLAVVALGALLTLAGCSSFLGPGQANPSDLAAEEAYDWDTDRAAYLEVNENNVTAVYTVSKRTTGQLDDADPTIEIYGRDTLGTEQPEQVSAVQFRYPNGTLVTFEERDSEAVAVVTYANGTTKDAPDLMTVDRTRRRTVIGLPANETGQLGVTIPKNGKQVSSPAYVQGSYEVVLPENAEVGVPLLAQVRPGASSRSVIDGQVHLRWDDLTANTLSIRYYLSRDLLLFGGLAIGGTIIGAIGLAYYALQLRETRRKRDEVGLDVDVEDDDRDGPPPGMR